jgi:hypothetical protein
VWYGHNTEVTSIFLRSLFQYYCGVSGHVAQADTKSPGCATGSSTTAFHSNIHSKYDSLKRTYKSLFFFKDLSFKYDYCNNIVTQGFQIRQLVPTLAMSWELAMPHHQNLTVTVSILIL